LELSLLEKGHLRPRKEVMQKFLNLLFLIAFSFTIVNCSASKDSNPKKNKNIVVKFIGPIIVASVSSDGLYAITTGLGKYAILWDIKNKRYKILDDDANIYSAYFVRHSNKFMWQHDSNNEVIIEDLAGKKILAFKAVPTYSHIITSDLKHYFTNDENWFIYAGDPHKKIRIINKGFLDFIGAGKPLNINMSVNQKYLVTSGDCYKKMEQIPLDKPNGDFNIDCITLWQIYPKIKPVKKIWGNMEKTYATISPDSKYIVSGDEQPLAFLWNATNGKKVFNIYDLYYGKSVKVTNTDDPLKDYRYIDTGFVKPPKGFDGYNPYNGALCIMALKFISNKQYLRFTDSVPYAILFDTLSPKPKKYIKLGILPPPSIYQFSRDNSIDTSPSAHILVTGQETTNGINVYKYNPKTETLKLIWSPIIPNKKKYLTAGVWHHVPPVIWASKKTVRYPYKIWSFKFVYPKNKKVID
jgi:WD40 repeat protein